MELNSKITVAIRNKNESTSLEFLLKTLYNNYIDDIDQIIIIDNCSTDSSKEVAKKYGAEFVLIENFSYGRSANLAMELSLNNIVVIMSAHVFPVSHDFFRIIKNKFNLESLAGLRCIHYSNDYRLYLEKISFNEDMNGCGLNFACSVVNKKVWEIYRFKDDIVTNEDKEWSKRVFYKGYSIEMIPSIFCYEIKRSRSQIFFRFKNETLIQYYLWGNNPTYKFIFKNLIANIFRDFQSYFLNNFYSIKRFIFLIGFKLKN